MKKLTNKFKTDTFWAAYARGVSNGLCNVVPKTLYDKTTNLLAYGMGHMEGRKLSTVVNQAYPYLQDN